MTITTCWLVGIAVGVGVGVGVGEEGAFEEMEPLPPHALMVSERRTRNAGANSGMRWELVVELI
jgi:hypothetical protein